MNGEKNLQYWEVWYPQAAATGFQIARGLIDPVDSLIFHAAPPIITVIVTSQDGNRLAIGKDLQATANTPMCRLTIEGQQIWREDIWPDSADHGSLVLLPGGEAGKLLQWWNADDEKEWRWQVEFYNTLRE